MLVKCEQKDLDLVTRPDVVTHVCDSGAGEVEIRDIPKACCPASLD